MSESPHPRATGAPPVAEEARCRALLDRLPQVVYEMDLAGRFTFVNRAGLAAFGYTAAEVAAGIMVDQIVVPEQRERLRENLGRRVRGGPPEDYEYTALRRDGSTFPCIARTEPILEGGRPVGLQGYLVDITARARIEEELRYRIAFEQLIMGISARLVAVTPAGVDAGIEEALAAIGGFLAVDRAYVFLLDDGGLLMDNTHEWAAAGVDPERGRLQRLPVSGFPWFVAELRARRVLAIDAVAGLPPAAAAERVEFEREGIRSLACVAMMRGERLVGFLGLDAVRRDRCWTADETALLRVVGELFTGALLRTRAESALRESEGKYEALVESTATGFVEIDEAGRVLDANAEYVRLAGRRSLGEILGRPVTEWTAPRDRERNAREVRRCFECGFVRNLQVDYAHPDGATLPVEINAAVVETRGGRRIVTVIRDVSERRRLEAEMLRAEKLRSVGVLAGGIAHDFNNILTSVLGSVSLLRETLPAGADDAGLLAEAERACLRARGLTGQLLAFARGGAPVKRPFLPAATVRDSATLALRGRGSSLDLAVPEGLWPVDGDEGQVGQLVNNLVINASEAMGGGGTVSVAAANRRLADGEHAGLPAGSYVEIEVADRGPGVPEEHRERIFDPYFTTKGEGSGLGLAVCYAVATAHGGTVAVGPAPGGGAVFRVLLPAFPGAAVASGPAGPAVARGRGRVLVMDDEEAVRSIACRMLASLGYEAEGAREGGEAVARWEEGRRAGRPFDLAVLDLTVPGGMGGLETLQALRAADPGARALVSSGYSDGPVVSRWREHGFAGVVPKPYSLAELSSAVVRALGTGGREITR